MLIYLYVCVHTEVNLPLPIPAFPHLPFCSEAWGKERSHRLFWLTEASIGHGRMCRLICCVLRLETRRQQLQLLDCVGSGIRLKVLWDVAGGQEQGWLGDRRQRCCCVVQLQVWWFCSLWGNPDHFSPPLKCRFKNLEYTSKSFH